MTVQDVIVWIIVVVCLIFVIRSSYRKWRNFRKGKADCSGCPLADQCGKKKKHSKHDCKKRTFK